MEEFTRFLDAKQAQRLLQQHHPRFAAGNLVIRDCQILRSRFKTYEKASSRAKSFLTLCYQLEIAEKSSGSCYKQQLYVKAYLAGRGAKEFQDLQTLSLCGEAVVHLPAVDAIVWTFPHDPLLSQLPRVIDPELVKSYLPYDQLSLTAANRFAVNVDVVHYYPEQRCTCRYDLKWEAANQPQTCALYGKTFHNHDEGRELHRRMEYFWKKSVAGAAGLWAAKPLGYNEASRTVWQQAVCGKSLRSVLDANNAETWLRAVAKSLAAMHQSDLPNLPRRHFNELLPEARKKSLKLAQAFPALKARLQSIAKNLEKTSSAAAPFTTLIHGDFQIKQMLVSDDKIFVFDFDELAYGDPLQDVASFVVDLHLHHFEANWLRRMANFFCEAYRAGVAWPMPSIRLNWYLQLYCIIKAYRVLTYWQQQPGFAQDIEHLVNVAIRLD